MGGRRLEDDVTDILITWAVMALSLFVAAQFLTRMKISGGIGGHFAVSAGFGLLMILTGWFFYLVLGSASFGLLTAFAFVAKILVTGIVLKLTAVFSDRLEIQGLATPFLAALIMAVTGGVAQLLVSGLVPS